jgi:hypothetical protein
MNHHQPATSLAAGHWGTHRPNAASRAAAAVWRLTTEVTARAALHRAALAAASTGVAAALALSPSTPSLAAAIPIVNTTSQAGYQAGNNAWNFRYVQAVVTLPLAASPQYGCPVTSSPNYLESSLQLIGTTGFNAAIGVSCNNIQLLGNRYRVGWTVGYLGNLHPPLNQLGPLVNPGDRIRG